MKDRWRGGDSERTDRHIDIDREKREREREIER